MAVVTIEQLGEVGVELAGVDRDRLLTDRSLPDLCRRALEAHGVVVFRDLHADDRAQVEFCRTLGQVEIRPGRPVPGITVIAYDPARSPIADYVTGTFEWHMDGTMDDIPNKATALSAHALSDGGGETEFASTYQAFDSLTDEERRRLEGLRVVHSVAATQRAAPSPTEQPAKSDRVQRREHPIVWRHRSGRCSLVIGSTTDHVVGMPAAESDALLAGLLERATPPGSTYLHHWRVGDLVVWDNAGLLHRAHPYEPSSPREMHRTVLLGDEPIE